MHHFVKEFVKRPRDVGAVSASSRKLASVMIKAADLSNAKVVVELGPGTGIFTEHIVKEVPAHVLFFALELNPVFAARTRERCPRAIVYQDSAANLKAYLAKHNVDKCDCIISGLPWGVFEKPFQEELFESIFDALAENGKFLTFTYVGGPLLAGVRRFKKLLISRFPKISRTAVVWRNLPPAFVYCCDKGQAKTSCVNVC